MADYCDLCGQEGHKQSDHNKMPGVDGARKIDDAFCFFNSIFKRVEERGGIQVELPKTPRLCCDDMEFFTTDKEVHGAIVEYFKQYPKDDIKVGD